MIGQKWRATVLLSVVLVVMGASVGFKLYSPDGQPASTRSSPEVRTIAGDVAQTPTGPLQVQIAVVGTTIVAVDELQTATAYSRSLAINDRALPLLEHQTLRTQSADIDSVSGATFTSEAYRTSLQSAIDRR